MPRNVDMLSLEPKLLMQLRLSSDKRPPRWKENLVLSYFKSLWILSPKFKPVVSASNFVKEGLTLQKIGRWVKYNLKKMVNPRIWTYDNAIWFIWKLVSTNNLTSLCLLVASYDTTYLWGRLVVPLNASLISRWTEESYEAYRNYLLLVQELPKRIYLKLIAHQSIGSHQTMSRCQGSLFRFL